MQVSQASVLTDRQGEERRILDLENAVKSVRLHLPHTKSSYCLKVQLLCDVHYCDFGPNCVCVAVSLPGTLCEVQLERERLDLRSQVCLLKENREAVEVELKVRSAALVQNAEEVAQQRAESNALRFVLKTCQIKIKKTNNMKQ